MSQTNDMSALRDELFATLRGLKAKTIDIDTARMVNDVAKTLVDTAKVEVEYLRVTDGSSSTFIPSHGPALPAPAPEGANNGIVSITRHAIGR